MAKHPSTRTAILLATTLAAAGVVLAAVIAEARVPGLLLSNLWGLALILVVLVAFFGLCTLIGLIGAWTRPKRPSDGSWITAVLGVWIPIALLAIAVGWMVLARR
jgi:hypothetical protein